MMNTAYCCPNCKTNRSRFTIIEQHPRIVKVDADTGDIMKEFTLENKDPFHLTYRGPDRRIQCGVCGLLEDEEMFKKFATYQRKEIT